MMSKASLISSISTSVSPGRSYRLALNAASPGFDAFYLNVAHSSRLTTFPSEAALKTYDFQDYEELSNIDISMLLDKSSLKFPAPAISVDS